MTKRKEMNMITKRLFTSESVTEGHPDKICDNISDAVLDAILAQDPMGRVACETTATTGVVTEGGERSASGGPRLRGRKRHLGGKGEPDSDLFRREV